jgi:hypothetical protein
VEAAVAAAGDDVVADREAAVFGGVDLVGADLAGGLEEAVGELVEGAADRVAAVDHRVVVAGLAGGPPPFEHTEVSVGRPSGDV